MLGQHGPPGLVLATHPPAQHVPLSRHCQAFRYVADARWQSVLVLASALVQARPTQSESPQDQGRP